MDDSDTEGHRARVHSLVTAELERINYRGDHNYVHRRLWMSLPWPRVWNATTPSDVRIVVDQILRRRKR